MFIHKNLSTESLFVGRGGNKKSGEKGKQKCYVWLFKLREEIFKLLKTKTKLTLNDVCLD